MKINEQNNKTGSGKDKNSSKTKFSEFLKDKRTRWMAIAFVVMIAVTIMQFVLPHLIK